MRHVTFSRPVSPHGVGDRRLVPEDVAERLEQEGALSANEPWPDRAPDRAGAAPETPGRKMFKPARPTGARDQRMTR